MRRRLMHPRRISLVVSSLSDKFHCDVAVAIFRSHLLAKSITLLTSTLHERIILLTRQDKLKQLLKLAIFSRGNVFHESIIEPSAYSSKVFRAASFSLPERKSSARKYFPCS